MGIFMNYPGLKGDATETSFKDWITLTSINLDTSRHISAFAGSGAGREASVPKVSDISVSKLLDASSAGLFRASVGYPLHVAPTVDIVLTRTGAQGKEYLKYRLDHVLVTSYQFSTNDRGFPSESVSLSCTMLHVTVTTTDSANKLLAPMTVSYDISGNAAH